MSKPAEKKKPFYFTMMMMLPLMLGAIVAIQPRKYVEMGDFSISVAFLMFAFGILSFCFGFAFNLYAVICARKAHAAKLASAASQAEAADSKAA